MSESVPPASGPPTRGPIYWLITAGVIVALFAVGLLIRELDGNNEETDSATVTAVASITPTPSPTPTASPSPTPTPTASPSPTATATGTPRPTETPTPTTSPEPATAQTPQSPTPRPPATVPTEAPTVASTEAPTPSATATPTATPTVTNPQGDGAGESYAYGQTDRIRSDAGLSALDTNSGLASVARSWSESMRQAGSLTHNPSTPSQIPSGWTRWAENVAHASTIAEAMSLLEASPLHYQNMTYAAFTDVGIGVVVDGDGWVWVTQVFAQY